MIKIFNSSLLNSIKYIEMAGAFSAVFLKGTYKYPKAFLSLEFYELEKGIFVVWEGIHLPENDTLSLRAEGKTIADLKAVNGYALGAALTDGIAKDDFLYGKISLMCADEEISYGKALF